MTSKKFTSQVLVVLFSLSIFAAWACKKDGTTPPATKKAIQGLWEGTYLVDQLPQKQAEYFSLILKPGGIVIAESKANGVYHISTGTWQMKGDTLLSSTLCVYGLQSNVGSRQTQKAVFDSTTGTLNNAIWINPSPATNTGKLMLSKIQ